MGCFWANQDLYPKKRTFFKPYKSYRWLKLGSNDENQMNSDLRADLRLRSKILLKNSFVNVPLC